MKIFISADIEGIAGVTDRDECIKQSPEGKDFLEQMTLEVAAACDGARKAGATKILVKDAHGGGRNIIPSMLPEGVSLFRGWAGHPYQEMEGLDETFQAAIMVGYHARAGSADSPRAHTIHGDLISHIKLNGRYASEFLINTYTAALVNVPVVFVSGDKGICDEIADFHPPVTTIAVKKGIGNATINIHPKTAVKEIKAGVSAALKGKIDKSRISLPDHFSMEIKYTRAGAAYKPGFYPGASLHPKDSSIVRFESDDYFEILRFLLFVTV